MMPIIRRRSLGRIALLVLAVWNTSCRQEGRPFGTGDPVKDARASLARGDHRLLAGEYGWWPEVPGLPDNRFVADSIVRAHGMRIIVKMSDLITTDSKRMLRDSSQAYAERYNATMLAAEGQR